MNLIRLTLLGLVACFPTPFDASDVYDYGEKSEIGPANWGAVEVEHNECDGDYNSPIAIESSSCSLFANYRFNQGNCTVGPHQFSLTKNGVKYTFDDGECEVPHFYIPKEELVDEKYTALQFLIHISSEHTLDGNYYGAELQIVHVNDAEDRIAIVSLMIMPTADENHPLFEDMLAGWEGEASSKCDDVVTTDGDAEGVQEAEEGGRRHRRLQRTINIYDLVPDDSTFYYYDGGLTTPPCTEAVWWNVNDTPIKLSPAQYFRLVRMIVKFRDPESCEFATLANQHGSTSRPLIPLNKRVVERICPRGFQDDFPVNDESGSRMMLTSRVAVIAAGVVTLLV